MATFEKTGSIILKNPNLPSLGKTDLALPAIITQNGERTTKRFLEYFTARIRNPNTRRAYYRSVSRFLLWCENYQIDLATIEPIMVSAYIEALMDELSAPSVKQHLAAIRELFDYMVTGGILPYNPAAAVRGPKHVVKTGKTPVLTPEEARMLFDTIDHHSLVGKRDRALLGVMTYSFARVGAVVKMRIQDYFTQGRNAWFILHEKGGKYHKVPAHHKAVDFLEDYLTSADIWNEKRSHPLFRSFGGRGREISERPLYTTDVLRMIKRRSVQAGLSPDTCCHTFRATGITAYMASPGASLEKAAQIANHASTRTTQIYNRNDDEVNRTEIERIMI
ncbi:MAG: tyrosine-type recombinase/integrase [Magnetococcales bacterium]|nr:tyrosine-type recombinase/integrase [Magnetococcales bacterium]